MSDRIIAHLDMDAFFASVEEVTTPAFFGKPIVVGSEIINGVGRGVVSTANYKARAYGIHSALPISVAWRLSQEAKKQGKDEVIFLPVDFELYNKVSAYVRQIIDKYSSLVEQASVDEFYFDLTNLGSFKKADFVCKKIKEEIKKEKKLTCSIGVGPNKLISKIAAGFKKPDGLFLVTQEEAQGFLNPLPIREISGIGPKTAELLYKENIRTVKDLNKFSLEELKNLLGKQGERIYYSVRGVDDSSITEHHEVKSIGEQTTFSQNTLDVLTICDKMTELSRNVFKTFEESGFYEFKTITITVRFADFETKTSSKSFKDGINKNNKNKFELEVLKLILPFLDKRSNPKRKPVRLIGVRLEKISTQNKLF